MGCLFVLFQQKKRVFHHYLKLVISQSLIWKKKNFNRKINTWMENIIKKLPPLHKGRSIKFKYITQPNSAPPKFNIYVNYIKAIKPDYKRFLENNIRKNFNLNGLPIKIIYKKSKNPFTQK